MWCSEATIRDAIIADQINTSGCHTELSYFCTAVPDPPTSYCICTQCDYLSFKHGNSDEKLGKIEPVISDNKAK